MHTVNSPRRQSKKPTQAEENKGIALYPGSFKPPHAAHLYAVQHLLNNVQVAKVVIIISNRCRLIPGTNRAIDAKAARELFRKLLHSSALPLDRIRIEIAKHRATSHALDYFDKAGVTQQLLFCLGSADFAAQDDRFAQVRKCSRKTGIPARIEVLPKAPFDVHAIDLRRFLSMGAAGRKGFILALPRALSTRQKKVIWEDCRHSLRPISEIC